MALVHVDARRNPVTVAISGELTFSHVSECREELERAAGAGKDVDVALEEVTSFDLAGIQLLFSLKRSAEAAGVSVAFHGGANEERFGNMLAFAGLPTLWESS
ncbi:MAG: STAS domain-containing protein [Spirochaetes bacterium]|jgi:anti-anti-sigma factor|nr:STAS domain-containing protein [Spirochaetota bacterium]